jgi:hypothetical protein
VPKEIAKGAELKSDGGYAVAGPRHYPRGEPCALGARARFCAGGLWKGGA